MKIRSPIHQPAGPGTPVLRLSLYSKILLWFLLNLLVLAGFGLGFMKVQLRLGLDWMLAGPGGERLEQLAEALTGELRVRPEAEWSRLLARREAELGLLLALFGSDGVQVLGPPLKVPKEILPKLIDKRSSADMPPSRRQREIRPQAPGAPPKPRFMQRSAHPTRYWAGIHLALAHGEGPSRRPLTLVLVSESPTGRGFFFNVWPWAGLAGVALLLSALIWLPVVGGITRAIRRANAASRSIAAGGFDVRLPEHRGDELGELAASVNRMAAQLGEYVGRQRRITADIAHELCSPIARMQMALGVVRQRGTPAQETYLDRLDAELQHMARLVGEVLEFSKAETLPAQEAAETFPLRQLVERVVMREAPEAEVRLDIADFSLHTRRNALDRALGNVLRNAVRYAREVEIIATADRGEVVILVRDRGPGVPEEALARLFEPFYRPEAARGRGSGGSGLGLAIARRCLEACGGSIRARLREGGGLEVEMRLPPNPG